MCVRVRHANLDLGELLMRLSRRSLLFLGAAAGAWGVASRIPLVRAADREALPHFLIAVQIQGGVDATYLFDARGPKVTDKNLQQNYLYKNDSGGPVDVDAFSPEKVTERTLTDPTTRARALMSPLVTDLWARHKDRLSIVNGVYMLRNNAGHGENSAYLFGNTETGGAPIYPPMVGKLLGGTPLESVILREQASIFPAPTNLSGSAELSASEVTALAATLTSGPQIDEASSTWQHIVSRCDANGTRDGMFGAGARTMASSLRRAKATGLAFAGATAGETGEEQASLERSVRRALAFFRGGVSRVAAILHDESVDAHDRGTAQAAGATYGNIATQLSTMIDLLKTTMFVAPDGSQIPFIDLTTFVISSEFSRTTRSLSFPSGSSVGATGTDHNPLTNSVLVGGRGIVGGRIVGESDLRDCDDAGAYTDVSGAHREKNAKLDQIMGKPFDFNSQQVRSDLPDAWREPDYLCMPSVTNTILEAMGVPRDQQFKLGGAPAPILTVLRRES